MSLAHAARTTALVPSILLAPIFLASVPGAAQRVRLSAPLVSGGSVTSALLGADSMHAVYRADQDVNEVHELYAVALDAPSLVWKLSGTMVTGGDVSAFHALSADSQHVVYLADQIANDRDELFSVPLAGGTPIRLNGTLVTNGDVWHDFSISPDSSRVVYRADQDVLDVDELYSVPIGGGTAVQLSGVLPAGGDVFGVVKISPDSTRVVYVADQDVNDRAELYSAPLDGSAPAVKLNAPLVAGGGVYGLVWALVIAPDSSRVVYVAVQDTPDVAELYGVPLDGSAAPVKISGALAPGGAVKVPKVSPDSSRVVYTADQDVDEVVELYSAPLDGSAAPVQLSGALVAGGDVALSFHQISPDSSRVVYVADQDVDGVSELYSVPLDGSAPPVKLHPPLGPGRGVNAALVAIDADSTRALFVGILGAPNVIELYSAPLDGSAPPVTLNAPLVPNGDVEGFVLAPGGRALYYADQEIDGLTEVFAVPIDGSRLPRRVHAPGQSVGILRPASGDRMLYTAGAATSELFLTSLGRVRRSGF